MAYNKEMEKEDKESGERVDKAYKLIDLAKKSGVEAAPLKDRKFYPSICLDGEQSKLFKGKNVGDVCTVKAILKVRSISESDSGSHMDLDVQKIGYED